jgi:hypothetical protein
VGSKLSTGAGEVIHGVGWAGQGRVGGEVALDRTAWACYIGFVVRRESVMEKASVLPRSEQEWEAHWREHALKHYKIRLRLIRECASFLRPLERNLLLLIASLTRKSNEHGLAYGFMTVGHMASRLGVTRRYAHMLLRDLIDLGIIQHIPHYQGRKCGGFRVSIAGMFRFRSVVRALSVPEKRHEFAQARRVVREVMEQKRKPQAVLAGSAEEDRGDEGMAVRQGATKGKGPETLDVSLHAHLASLDRIRPEDVADLPPTPAEAVRIVTARGEILITAPRSPFDPLFAEPTEEEAQSFLETTLIRSLTKEEAAGLRCWLLDRQATGWVRGSLVPVANWRADLLSYYKTGKLKEIGRKALETEQETARTPQRNVREDRQSSINSSLPAKPPKMITLDYREARQLWHEAGSPGRSFPMKGWEVRRTEEGILFDIPYEQFVILKNKRYGG